MQNVTITFAGNDSFNQTIARIAAWNVHNAMLSQAEGPERAII